MSMTLPTMRLATSAIGVVIVPVRSIGARNDSGTRSGHKIETLLHRSDTPMTTMKYHMIDRPSVDTADMARESTNAIVT